MRPSRRGSPRERNRATAGELIGAVAGHRGLEVQQPAQRPGTGSYHQMLADPRCAAAPVPARVPAAPIPGNPRSEVLQHPGLGDAVRCGHRGIELEDATSTDRVDGTGAARVTAQPGARQTQAGSEVGRGGPDDLLVEDDGLPLLVRMHSREHARKLPRAEYRPQSNFLVRAAPRTRSRSSGKRLRLAATTSLRQPRRRVRVVAATTSLGGSPEAGAGGDREAGGAGVAGEVLMLTPKRAYDSPFREGA